MNNASSNKMEKFPTFKKSNFSILRAAAKSKKKLTHDIFVTPNETVAVNGNVAVRVSSLKFEQSPIYRGVKAKKTFPSFILPRDVAKKILKCFLKKDSPNPVAWYFPMEKGRSAKFLIGSPENYEIIEFMPKRVEYPDYKISFYEKGKYATTRISPESAKVILSDIYKLLPNPSEDGILLKESLEKEPTIFSVKNNEQTAKVSLKRARRQSTIFNFLFKN
jgi:hypothetical protein